MTEDEARAALLEFRHAYTKEPLPDIQAQQHLREFRAHQWDTVVAVIRDLTHRGLPRPGPVDMGGMLRSKAGLAPAGARAQRHGPLLDTEKERGDRGDITPPDEAAAHFAELRSRLTHPSGTKSKNPASRT